MLFLQIVCDSSVCVVKERSQGKGSSFIDNKCLKSWLERQRWTAAYLRICGAHLARRDSTVAGSWAGQWEEGGRRGGLGRK